MALHFHQRCLHQLLATTSRARMRETRKLLTVQGPRHRIRAGFRDTIQSNYSRMKHKHLPYLFRVLLHRRGLEFQGRRAQDSSGCAGTSHNGRLFWSRYTCGMRLRTFTLTTTYLDVRGSWLLLEHFSGLLLRNLHPIAIL